MHLRHITTPLDYIQKCFCGSVEGFCLSLCLALIMEILKKDFEASLPTIREAILEADFISIDAEFSGKQSTHTHTHTHIGLTLVTTLS